RPLTAPSPQQELIEHLDGYRQAGVAYVLTPPGQALPQSPTTFRLVYRSPSTWIYRLAGAAPYFAASNPACDVREPSNVSVHVSCPTRAVLVRRETELPGWTAKVDGRSVPIRRTDGLFQTIDLAKGSQRVTFHYSPPHIAWGFVAFAVGCTWVLG